MDQMQLGSLGVCRKSHHPQLSAGNATSLVALEHPCSVSPVKTREGRGLILFEYLWLVLGFDCVRVCVSELGCRCHGDEKRGL